ERCCACAANGQAVAVPPSSVVLGRAWAPLPEPAVPAYRRLRMPRKHPQVLGGDLNRSESSRQPACPRLSLAPPALRERRHREPTRVALTCVGAPAMRPVAAVARPPTKAV